MVRLAKSPCPTIRGLGGYREAAVLIVMVVVFAIGVFVSAIGIGLLSIKTWARAVTEALAYINLTCVALDALRLLGNIIQMFGAVKPAPYSLTSATWVAILLTAAALNGWIVFCSSRPHLKQAFGENSW